MKPFHTFQEYALGRRAQSNGMIAGQIIRYIIYTFLATRSTHSRYSLDARRLRNYRAGPITKNSRGTRRAHLKCRIQRFDLPPREREGYIFFYTERGAITIMLLSSDDCRFLPYGELSNKPRGDDADATQRATPGRSPACNRSCNIKSSRLCAGEWSALRRSHKIVGRNALRVRRALDYLTASCAVKTVGDQKCIQKQFRRGILSRGIRTTAGIILPRNPWLLTERRRDLAGKLNGNSYRATRTSRSISEYSLPLRASTRFTVKRSFWFRENKLRVRRSARFVVTRSRE